jgi:hypothetical protein
MVNAGLRQLDRPAPKQCCLAITQDNFGYGHVLIPEEFDHPIIEGNRECDREFLGDCVISARCFEIMDSEVHHFPFAFFFPAVMAWA